MNEDKYSNIRVPFRKKMKPKALLLFQSLKPKKKLHQSTLVFFN